MKNLLLLSRLKTGSIIGPAKPLRGLYLKTSLLLLLSLFLAAPVAISQVNVRADDIMYKKELVRALDLREPQNSPLFAKNKEISALLIEGVMNGKLTPYSNDSLAGKLSIENFTKRMIMPTSEALPTDTNELKILYPDTWEEMLKNPPKPDLYFARDLYQMEIKEDLLFDKERSKMYYDIKSITIFIPADHPSNIKGIQEPVASFDYRELVKFLKDNPKAVWFNNQNDAEHKNLADAFELRLFSSYIIKVSNAGDQYLSDLYKDPETGIMSSQWAAYELLEYEHNLWEF